MFEILIIIIFLLLIHRSLYYVLKFIYDVCNHNMSIETGINHNRKKFIYFRTKYGHYLKNNNEYYSFITVYSTFLDLILNRDKHLTFKGVKHFDKYNAYIMKILIILILKPVYNSKIKRQSKR